MNVHIETPRLLIRNIMLEDAAEMYAMDSQESVMRYIGMPPVESIDETKKIIGFIQAQYQRNGTGRWAMILKETQQFIGWSGIKYMDDSSMDGKKDFYDIGYRLHPDFWGKGYCTEAAQACLDYGMNEMKLPELVANVMEENHASRRVAEKIGMRYSHSYMEDGNNWRWYVYP
ncbi:MAG: GNAT family N-acetyltransferase [Saprospiraceae bacterium]